MAGPTSVTVSLDILFPGLIFVSPFTGNLLIDDNPAGTISFSNDPGGGVSGIAPISVFSGYRKFTVVLPSESVQITSQYQPPDGTDIGSASFTPGNGLYATIFADLIYYAKGSQASNVGLIIYNDDSQGSRIITSADGSSFIVTPNGYQVNNSVIISSNNGSSLNITQNGSQVSNSVTISSNNGSRVSDGIIISAIDGSSLNVTRNGSQGSNSATISSNNGSSLIITRNGLKKIFN